jgi:Lhr-like helicase
MLQRLGRGGHRPGALRTGTLFVGSQIELLEAVTTKGAAEDGISNRSAFLMLRLMCSANC